jgi:quercetin dioxygenase-like cupin family protein
MRWPHHTNQYPHHKAIKMEQDTFMEILADEGFKEMVTVTREPDGSLEMHTHPFEAKALILRGELQLQVGDEDRCYRVGQVFHLLADVQHSEQYGPEGVTYLVGRR